MEAAPYGNCKQLPDGQGIAEPAPFGGKLTQPRPQRGIVRSPGAVSNGFAIRPDQ